MNNNDRRIRKTKKALREALAKLLSEKELHNITVQELADTADIHRGTFYAHYQDVYDLFNQIEDSVIEELTTLMASDEDYTCEGLYTALVAYIYDNSHLCKAFFEKGNYSFQSRIGHWLETAYIKGWQNEKNDLQITEQLKFISSYHIRGCIAIIGRWVENDFAYPKSEIIKLLHDVDYNIDNLIC